MAKKIKDAEVAFDKAIEELKAEWEIKETVEEVKEVKETKKAVKKEEKPQVVSSKETICEFYGIRDEEILNWEDLWKYGISKEQEKVLSERADAKWKKEAEWNTVDLSKLSEEEKVIVEKYGLTPLQIIEKDFEELTKEEKKIMWA